MARRVIEETEDPVVHGRASFHDPELDRTGHFVGLGVHVLSNGEGDEWDVDDGGYVTKRHTAGAEAPLFEEPTAVAEPEAAE